MLLGRMQVDLLLAEAQRRASLAKGDDLHAEHPCVELAGARDIGDGQHEVIEAFDVHIFDPLPQSTRHLDSQNLAGLRGS